MDDGSQHLELFPGLNIPSVPLSDQLGYQSSRSNHDDMGYQQDPQAQVQHQQFYPSPQEQIAMQSNPRYQELNDHHLLIPQNGYDYDPSANVQDPKYLVQGTNFHIVDVSQHYHHHHHHHHPVDDSMMTEHQEPDEEVDQTHRDPYMVAPITMSRITQHSYPTAMQLQQLQNHQHLILQQQQQIQQQATQSFDNPNQKKRKRTKSFQDDDQIRLDHHQTQIDLPQINQFSYQQHQPQPQKEALVETPDPPSPELDDSDQPQPKKRRGMISLDKRVFSKSSIEQSAPSVYCSVEKGMLNGKQYWTKDEDEKLKQAVATYGTDWVMVARVFNGERTGAQVSQRWNRVLNPNLKKGRWTEDEDILLQQLVQIHGEKAWSTIACQMKDRSDIQCRSHYFRVTKNRKNGKEKSSTKASSSSSSRSSAATSNKDNGKQKAKNEHQDDQGWASEYQMSGNTAVPTVFNSFASDEKNLTVRIKLAPEGADHVDMDNGNVKTKKTKAKAGTKTKKSKTKTAAAKKKKKTKAPKRKTAKQKKAEAAAEAEAEAEANAQTAAAVVAAAAAEEEMMQQQQQQHESMQKQQPIQFVNWPNVDMPDLDWNDWESENQQ